MRGSQRCNAKWILSALPAMAAEVQAEHRLNLARQIGKMAMRIERQFLAMSDPLMWNVDHKQSQCRVEYSNRPKWKN